MRTTSINFGRARLLEPNTEQLYSWAEVLHQYTASSLTYPSDAFPAMSGIAKAFQKVYDDTYVAGLWTKCLPEMLLWYFETDPGVLNINTETWRAPSWSWASQNWNQDLNWLPCQQSVARIKDILCEPSGVDPTGQLKTAYMTLTTKAISACLLPLKGSDELQYVLRLGPGCETIQASHKHVIWLHLETSFCGISDLRLAAGILCLDVVMVQVGHHWGDHYISRHQAFGTEKWTKKHITSCILLAQHPDHTERWVRVGLVAVTDVAYESAFQDVKEQDGCDDEWLYHGTEAMTERLRTALETRAAQSREIFQRFEDAPMQDFVMW